MRGVFPAFALVLFIACGGGSGSGNPNPPPPTTQNPCATAALETDVPRADPQSSSHDKKEAIDGNSRWRVLEALWTHRQMQARREARTPQTTIDAGQPAAPPQRAADVGEIAIVQDTGNLVLPANIYDIENVGLRFARNGSGGYDVSKIDGTFRSALGSRVTLQDDDSINVNVAFSFPFYGQPQTVAFVNSDGNITFGEEDKASTERNVPRLLTGPPRLALFLADLDPTTGTGRIFVNAAADQYTVTWCNVRGFESTGAITAQATLLPDGGIEFKYGQIGVANTIVGVSPGRTGVFTPVNLSDAGPSGGGSGAVGERFAASGELDTVALTKEFYKTHGDNYDQLVVWTDLPYVRDAFAYEQTIANEVTGIGIPVFDLARDFGSGGRLRSMAMMDAINKYPDNPATKFLGENNTLSILGQEVGHRWLAFVDFRDHNGQRSDALLGRGLSHWSFFFDSDASVMEGNDIQQLSDGSFRTVAAVQRYSLLDQYMMGLVPPSAVPTFFYVDNPMLVSPIRDREAGPLVNVTFTGTRREVLIQDIIAIHGPRNPASAATSKVHRQAFVLLVTAGRNPDSAHIDKIDRIRRAWEAFFLEATSGRMTADTRLQ